MPHKLFPSSVVSSHIVHIPCSGLILFSFLFLLLFSMFVFIYVWCHYVWRPRALVVRRLSKSTDLILFDLQKVSPARILTALTFNVALLYTLLAGCCSYAHQQWCAVRFLTSLSVILAERKLCFDLCAKSEPSIYTRLQKLLISPNLTLIL